MHLVSILLTMICLLSLSGCDDRMPYSENAQKKPQREVVPLRECQLENGRIVPHGASVESLDNCNTCRCDDGGLACTEMGCVAPPILPHIPCGDWD